MTSTLTVPESVYVQDLNVQFSIATTNVAGLDVRLKSPDDVEIILFTEVDNNGDDFNGTLDDEASTSVYVGYPPFDDSYQPGQPLSTFDGMDAAGTWTLTITDLGNATGTLWSWSLCIEELNTQGRMECPAGFWFSQPPDDASGTWTSALSTLAVSSAMETFSGLSSPITALSWWGYFSDDSGGAASACTPPEGTFYVEFRAPDFFLVFASYSVSPVAEATGVMLPLSGGTAELHRYTWELPEPVTLPEGRVTVQYFVDSTCRFHWMSSPVGDDSHRLGGSNLQRDLAFCIEAQAVGEGEGEGGLPPAHSADWHGGQDNDIDLTELLRVIQFYNSGGYHCAETGEASDEGFLPGPPVAGDAEDTACAPHSSDYNAQDWDIGLSELLRVIQFYNSSGYYPCAEGEDGFCPGTP